MLRDKEDGDPGLTAMVSQAMAPSESVYLEQLNVTMHYVLLKSLFNSGIIVQRNVSSD